MPRKKKKTGPTRLEKLESEYVPIDSIKPNTYNPNRQDDAVFALLKRSIKEDGFTQPIIVQKETNEIVDGEHRWRASQELGHKEIPVVFVNMTDAQMRIATLRHNRTRGDEDHDSVVSLMSELDGMGALSWAVDSLMMSEEELNSLIDVSSEFVDDAIGNSDKDLDLEPDTTEVLEKLKDLPERTKLGETWILGRHKMLIGDVYERLKEIPDDSIQCVVTSPPYWNLRDYGTATWDGGDPECDHIQTSGSTRGGSKSTITGGQDTAAHKGQFVNQCAKCGATRTDDQLGLEETPEKHVLKMVDLFSDIKRVLRDDGVCFINYGDSYFSADAARHDAQGSDMGDKVHRDSQGHDYACFGLCDECSTALSTRNVHKNRRRRGASKTHENGVQHTDVSGPRPGETDASLPGVPESTTHGSSQLLPDLCLHCANCGACLSVLRSSSRDARLCVRKELYKRSISLSGSDVRNQDRDASGLAWGYSTMANLKSKDLVGMPWRVAFGLQADGWYLRSDIIWHKPNPMPESVTDRPTKSHEHLFLLTKSGKYFYDADAVREGDCKWNSSRDFASRQNMTAPELAKGADLEKMRTRGFGTHHPDVDRAGRNLRDVWTIATQPMPDAHFATYPEKLVEPCIKAGTGKEGTVFDPFGGAGTTMIVAEKLGRSCISTELNPKYADIAIKRWENLTGQKAEKE